MKERAGEKNGKRQEQPIAIAIIHGMGRQKADFAVELKRRLTASTNCVFRKRELIPKQEPFVYVPIYWAPLADKLQDELEQRVGLDLLSWKRLRRYIIGYLGDAIAYQLPLSRKEYLIDSIHREIKTRLDKLAKSCGEQAPLCVISHSLGTVISNEYFKTVQQMQMTSGLSPLAAGRTLALYYTMGSPVPIWALREKDYGSPPQVPFPSLSRTYPRLVSEWINFYSKYDVLGFPLKGINERYDSMVRSDCPVAAGGWLSRYTPLSHNEYWVNKSIIKRMAEALVSAWEAVNTTR